MGVPEHVPQRVREAVARTLRKQQRPLVEDAHEAGRIAARADVTASVGRRGRKENERRPLDELSRGVVEPVADLRPDEIGRHAEDAPQRALVADRVRVSGRDRSSSRPAVALVPVRRSAHCALTAPISLTTESFASPNSIVVRGSR